MASGRAHVPAVEAHVLLLLMGALLLAPSAFAAQPHEFGLPSIIAGGYYTEQLLPENVTAQGPTAWGGWVHQACQCPNATEVTSQCFVPAWADAAEPDVAVVGCEAFGARNDPDGTSVHATSLTKDFFVPFFGLKGGAGPHTDRFSPSVSPNGFLAMAPHGMVAGYTHFYSANLQRFTNAEWPMVALWVADFDAPPGSITITRRRHRRRVEASTGTEASDAAVGGPPASCDAAALQRQLECYRIRRGVPTAISVNASRRCAFENLTAAGNAKTVVEVDSLLVTYWGVVERDPVDANRANLTAQVELFSNGTVVMRYNATPAWPFNRRQRVPFTGLTLSADVRRLPWPVPSSPTHGGPDGDLTYSAARFTPAAVTTAAVASARGCLEYGAGAASDVSIESVDTCDALSPCADCTSRTRWIPAGEGIAAPQRRLYFVDCLWVDGAMAVGRAPAAAAMLRGRCVPNVFKDGVPPLQRMSTLSHECAAFSTVLNATTRLDGQSPPPSPWALQAPVEVTMATAGQPRRYQWARMLESTSDDPHEWFTREMALVAANGTAAVPPSELVVTHVANDTTITSHTGEGYITIRAPLTSEKAWAALPSRLATVRLPQPFDVFTYRPSLSGTPAHRCAPATHVNVSSQGYVHFFDPSTPAGNLSNATYAASPDALFGRGPGKCGAGVRLTFGFNPYTYCTTLRLALLKRRSRGAGMCGDDVAAVPHSNGSWSGECPASLALEWLGCTFNNQTSHSGGGGGGGPTRPPHYYDLRYHGPRFGAIVYDDGRGMVLFPTAAANFSDNMGYAALLGHSVGSEVLRFPIPGELAGGTTSHILGYDLQSDYSTLDNAADAVAPRTAVSFAQTDFPCPRCANGHACNASTRRCECRFPFVPPRCVSCADGFYSANASGQWQHAYCERCPACMRGTCRQAGGGKCDCDAGWYGSLCELQCGTAVTGRAAGEAALVNFTRDLSCQDLTLVGMSPFYDIFVQRTLPPVKAADAPTEHCPPPAYLAGAPVGATGTGAPTDDDDNAWVPVPPGCSNATDVDVFRENNSTSHTEMTALTNVCHRIGPGGAAGNGSPLRPYVSNLTATFATSLLGFRGGLSAGYVTPEATGNPTAMSADQLGVAVSGEGFFAFSAESPLPTTLAGAVPRATLWPDALNPREDGTAQVHLHRRCYGEWSNSPLDSASPSLASLAKQLRHFGAFGNRKAYAASGIPVSGGTWLAGSKRAGPWMYTLVATFVDVPVVPSSSSNGQSGTFTGQMELFPDGRVVMRFNHTPGGAGGGQGAVGVALQPMAGAPGAVNAVVQSPPTTSPPDSASSHSSGPSYRLLQFTPRAMSPAHAASSVGGVIREQTAAAAGWSDGNQPFTARWWPTNALRRQLLPANRTAPARVLADGLPPAAAPDATPGIPWTADTANVTSPRLFFLMKGMAQLPLDRVDPCEAFITCASCVSIPIQSRFSCVWCDGAVQSPLLSASIATEHADGVGHMPRWDTTGRCMTLPVAEAVCPTTTPALTTPDNALVRGCPSTYVGRKENPLRLYAASGAAYRYALATLAPLPGEGTAALPRDPTQPTLDSILRPFPTAAEASAVFERVSEAGQWPAQIYLTVPFDITLFPPSSISSSSPSSASSSPETSSASTTRALTVDPSGYVHTTAGMINCLSSAANVPRAVRAAVLPNRSQHAEAFGCFSWGSAAAAASSGTPAHRCPAAVLLEWSGIRIANRSQVALDAGASTLLDALGVLGNATGAAAAYDRDLTVRALIETDGNITVLVGGVAGFVAGGPLLGAWPGVAPVIGLQPPGLSGAESAVNVAHLPAVLAPYMSVRFSATGEVSCVPACEGRMRCNQDRSTCECSPGTVPPACTTCPPGSVYTMAPADGSNRPATCARCPTCYNGGTCIADGYDTARCVCPRDADGDACQYRCPLGRLAADVCAGPCGRVSTCYCGECWCNATAHGDLCPVNPAASETSLALFMVGLGIGLAGCACLGAFRVWQKYAARRNRWRNSGQLPPTPQHNGGDAADGSPEEGTLAYAIAHTSPLLLAQLVAHREPALAERAGAMHEATTNPLLLLPPPSSAGNVGRGAEEDAEELQDFHDL